MSDAGLPPPAAAEAAAKPPVVEDYDAFISYTHVPDQALAKAIKRGLLSLTRWPWRLPKLKVFRDEETLHATDDLPKSIQDHLDRSRYLILVASPASSEAPYVLAEIEYWLANKPPGRILLAVADGSISWPSGSEDFDWNKTTALPRMLEGELKKSPLWSNFNGIAKDDGSWPGLRDERFLDEIAKIGARLHGKPKDALVNIERRQRRRVRHVIRATVAVLAVLTVISAVSAIEAIDQRNKAEDRAREATSRRLAALSRTVRGTDGSLQYLLAAQAQRMWATTAARGALFEAAAGSDGQRVQQGTQGLARLVGHERGVKAVRLSPDGNRAGTVDGAGTVRVWASQGAGDPVTVPDLSSPRLAFTGNGEFVVSDGSRLQWRDAATGAVRGGRDLGFVPAHLEASGSGRTVLAAGSDASVVAARPDGDVEQAPDKGSSDVTFLGSPAHADVLVVGTTDGAVTVRNKKDLSVRTRWQLDTGAGTPVAVSADGSRIAVLKEQSEIKRAPDGRGFPVVSVRATQDGKELGTVRTTELYIPRDAAFIGRGSEVVVVTSGGVDGAPGQLLTADPAKDETAESPGLAVPDTAFAVRTSDDGRRLLVGGDGPTAYLDAIGPRDADFGGSVLPDDVEALLPLRVADSGRVVVRRNKQLGFADIGIGKPGSAVKVTMVTDGDSAEISTNGNWLVSPGGEVFDLRDAAAPKSAGRIPVPVGGLSFGGGGDRVAYVAGESELVVVDLPSLAVRRGSVGRRLCSANPCFASHALSPDGELLAIRPRSANSASDNPPTGSDAAGSPVDQGTSPLLLVSLQQDWKTRESVAVPQGGQLVFQDDETLLVQVGKSLLTVDVTAPEKTPVKRSAEKEGTWAFGTGRADEDLAISQDCGVFLTDPLTWGEIAKVPFDGVYTVGGCGGASAAWSGDTLLTSDGQDCYRSGARECPLRRWNTRAETLLERVCRLAARNFTRGEWSQYLPEWPYERTCTEYAEPEEGKLGVPTGTASKTAPAPGPEASSEAPPTPGSSPLKSDRPAEPTTSAPTTPTTAAPGPYPPGSVPTGSGGCSPGREDFYQCTVGKRDGAPYQDSPTGKPLAGSVTYGEHPFLCQRQGSAHTYGRYHNNWWARVVLREANMGGGWVNAVYLSGGDNDKPVPGLPIC
ncbi:toll/interleukin-1 receptor domain-containing protein [Streptomyces virginiae]|uniref:toll/interleukin-1 receptor domain-containing protein n=1 Tax=Streptomyces virginiae TaxID=1961 RepID=UPI0036470E1A